MGNQQFDPFTTQEIKNLRRYLRFGGFLLVDDSQGSAGFGFDKSFQREMKNIFPNNPLKTLKKDHTVFRSFYLLEQASGRVSTSSALKGVQIQGRTVLIYSQNDLFGALSRDPFGNWEFEISTGGYLRRKHSFRLGVNIVMYALCDDYKRDALHVEYILKRRRGR